MQLNHKMQKKKTERGGEGVGGAQEGTSASSSLPKSTEKSETWVTNGSFEDPTCSHLTAYMYRRITLESPKTSLPDKIQSPCSQNKSYILMYKNPHSTPRKKSLIKHMQKKIHIQLQVYMFWFMQPTYTVGIKTWHCCVTNKFFKKY